MKVAIVTDDGTQVSLHFGRAKYFAVVTLDEQRIVQRELRDIPARIVGDLSEHTVRSGHVGEHPDCHGFGGKAAADHQRIAVAVSDCQAVLAGGMSWAARECLAANGIRPIITDIATVDEAVAAYADGSIVDHLERLH